MNIEYISVSRLNTFNECNEKYKFKYHLKVVVDVPEKPYFLYGKVVHKIIEEYTLSRGNRSINEIKDEILYGKISLERTDDKQELPPIDVLPKDYLHKLPNHLIEFMKLTSKIGLEGECEWKFNYDLDPPNEKFVYGFIDRVIQIQDKLFILDYKTTKKGNWRKNKHTIIDDIQLQTYALVAWKMWNIAPENINTALFYLDGGDLIGARFTEKTLLDAEKLLRDSYDKIKSMNPDETKGFVSDRVCGNCDYRKLCKFYSLT